MLTSNRSILRMMVLAAVVGENAQPATGGAAAKPVEAAKIRFSKREYDLDEGKAYFTFGNNTELTLGLEEVPSDLHKRLALHGIIQKVGDSYASAKGNFNVAIEAAKSVIDQLKAGEWEGGGDEARPRLAELASAIAALRNAPLEKVTAAVEAATDEQRKAWRSNAQVKAKIAQQRAEKAAKNAEGSKEEITIDLPA